MTITLNYGVTFGKGDGSDVFEWEVDLDEEQEAAYRRALMTGASFEDFPELQALCDEAYPEIEEQELDSFINTDDEYTLECLGEAPVDPDEINDLVHSRDPHAIAFFGLDDLSEEELDEWDANELDELPLIKDFVEDFVPESPFDNGWTLNVWLPENDDEVDDEEIEEYLREALTANDVALAEEIVEGHEWHYEDAAEVAFKVAVQVGCFDYVRAHLDEIDLYPDGEETSPYLLETEDEEMRELLSKES